MSQPCQKLQSGRKYAVLLAERQRPRSFPSTVPHRPRACVPCMKPLPLLVTLSLAVNAALAAYLWTAGRDAARAAGEHASQAMGSPAAASFDSEAEEAIAWETWSAAGPEDLLRRLRTAGFPPHLQHAIVRAEVRRQFLPQRLELLERYPEEPYWQGPYLIDSPELRTALRELGREEQDLLVQLLGPAAREEDPLGDEMQRARFGDLPPEKAEQLQRILSDYNELRTALYMETGSVLLPEDRERRALLEQEQQRDLEALLSPEELREYELRSGQAARSLRSWLGIFQPTADEFLAIHDAYLAAKEELGPPAQWAQLLRVVVEAMKDEFDPARLELLDQALDPTMSTLNRIVARSELPPKTARDVRALELETRRRALQLQRDGTLSPAERAVRLEALQRETTDRVTTLLGPNAVATSRRLTERWLDNLNQATPGSPASPRP